MSTLAFAVPESVAQEFNVLSAQTQNQLGFELVFRIGQCSKSAFNRIAFASTLEKAQLEAKQNGLTESKLNSILAELGHAA